MEKTERCPLCDGSGEVVFAIPGGTFNSYLGNWEPAEDVERCGICRGTGRVAADEVAELPVDNEDALIRLSRQANEPDPDWFRE